MILILGAGPTGLGAAWRLAELGVADWTVLEAVAYPGGLAASFRDGRGFTWDVGGHVQFSHYDYFDRVMNTLLAEDEWIHHDRQSWIWMRERFIPYPFQNNIHRLPPEDVTRCLEALLQRPERAGAVPADFREWARARFGDGIWEIFLAPYNEKVWAHPPEMLSAAWVGERVAPLDLRRLLRALSSGDDVVDWGPNRTFRFPREGGTGAVWRRCAARLPAAQLRFGDAVTAIDPVAHRVRTASGAELRYTHLISTLPLAVLLETCGMTEAAAVARASLPVATTHVVGLGLRGQPPESIARKNWIYFPEGNCAFYRVTVFSNYSPHNVPDREGTWSLLCETSASPRRPVDGGTIVEQTIAGLAATRLLRPDDTIVSRWYHCAPFGYPVPGRERDAALSALLPALARDAIFSRGRFGAGMYEVSNQDHSFMQGVEVADRIVLGTAEETIADPDAVNRARPRDRGVPSPASGDAVAGHGAS